MTLPASFNITEVGPRDGLQNEKTALSVATRLELVENLLHAGVRKMEAGSFVSPKWVPHMAGSDELFQQLPKSSEASFCALAPNKTGLERALECGAQEVAVFVVPSESFSQKNTNCSVAGGIQRAAEVSEAALAAGLRVRGYASCIIDCPYEGPQNPADVAAISEELLAMGCYEVSLGDTIGTGTPGKMRDLINIVAARCDRSRLAVHCHDTYGQALANIYAALLEGINSADSSVAGLGGCPYAGGASGNVATEDLVYMLHGMGISTGIDLDLLVNTGQQICKHLGRPVVSRVSLALKNRAPA